MSSIATLQYPMSWDIQTISFQLLSKAPLTGIYADIATSDASNRGGPSYTTFETSATRSGVDKELTASQTFFPSATSTGILTSAPRTVTISSTGLSAGAIVGIALGGTLAFLLVFNIVFLLFHRTRRSVVAAQKEVEIEQKVELDDNARCHEMDGGSPLQWWNRWHNSFRRGVNHPQELPENARAELPEDTVPQELEGEPCTVFVPGATVTTGGDNSVDIPPS
ncbi:hypothetical protein IQ07DRAFT_600458 [Pyrenochaeta sp. DS3sAY3a]|nr:hypothetical protein IQ07DRAFT_600458 [Pyrenochaeta sp. DS3sAY3a]